MQQVNKLVQQNTTLTGYYLLSTVLTPCYLRSIKPVRFRFRFRFRSPPVRCRALQLDVGWKIRCRIGTSYVVYFKIY